jgi:hypothetical protein
LLAFRFGGYGGEKIVSLDFGNGRAASVEIPA